jgi:syntaxin 16
VLFKDLSTLVIEQGTILDRIDYNVKDAKLNVKKGVVELEKTLKREKSFRAQGCMACLFTSIVITLTLLMLKHM